MLWPLDYDWILRLFLFGCIADKRRRFSKYDEEPSDGQLGINEKELNSMNKHIPGTFLYGDCQNQYTPHMIELYETL